MTTTGMTGEPGFVPYNEEPSQAWLDAQHEPGHPFHGKTWAEARATFLDPRATEQAPRPVRNERDALEWIASYCDDHPGDGRLAPVWDIASAVLADPDIAPTSRLDALDSALGAHPYLWAFNTLISCGIGIVLGLAL